jgi:uncharacterized membrane protein
MKILSLNLMHKKTKLYKWASALALITIFYNIFEGLVSVYFGLEDETIALFGFGLDSFVEVISGLGIWHMIMRIKFSSLPVIKWGMRGFDESPDRFEKQALKITGTAFYILTAGLIAISIVNIYKGHKPETTLWGIIIAAISIITMWILIHFKIKVGRQLNSHAILADANCTKTCLYLSLVLLLSSIGYELTGIGGMDSIGAILIGVLSFREGREAFQKAKGKACMCS